MVDTNNEQALTERVLKLHATRPLHAVLPGFEFYVDTAARLAEQLGGIHHQVDGCRALAGGVAACRQQGTGELVAAYGRLQDASKLPDLGPFADEDGR